jgi:hypothetical protein
MGYIPDWQRQSAAKSSSPSGAGKEPTKFGVVSKPIFHGANQMSSNAKQSPFTRHYADGGDVDKAEGLALSNADREAGMAGKSGFAKLKQGLSDTFERLKAGNIDDRTSDAYWKYGAGRAETERDNKMRSANEAAGAANRGDNTSEWDAGRRPMTDFHYGKTKDAFKAAEDTSPVKTTSVDTADVGTGTTIPEDAPAPKKVAPKAAAPKKVRSLDAPAKPSATVQSFPLKTDSKPDVYPETKQALDPTPTDVRAKPAAPQTSTTGGDIRVGRGAVKVDSFFGTSRNRAGQIVDEPGQPQRDLTKDKRWYEMLIKKGTKLTEKEMAEARASGAKVD